MPGFLSPGKGEPLLLIPEYSGINKGQRVPDRSKTAHRKPLVKCFLTLYNYIYYINTFYMTFSDVQSFVKFTCHASIFKDILKDVPHPPN